MAGSGISYDVVLSERLGRTSSKEQYAYLYRYSMAVFMSMTGLVSPSFF